MFTADGSACYKTKQMHELDEAYGDIYSQIGDREVELLQKLASSVLEYSSQLMLASQLSGELDAILALALGAQKYGWTEPDITRNGHTRIVGGRHPLHEASMQHFIPNDFGAPVDEEGSDQRSGRVLVVTGPNNSGKSVYLKQVALIVYLAHTGSFVPADKAAITVTDKILVCIPAQESASLNESAFATDLRKVLHSVTQATDKSLVLVDEFGKGTCPVNGAGLAAGLLAHFLSLGSRRCPRVIIATHFHEILELDYFRSNEALSLAHMEVKVKHDDIGTDDDPLTYLFLLQRGRSSFSFGEQCATMNRVPGAVVNRAGALSLIIDRDGDLAAACATLSHAEQVRLEIAEKVARKFVSYDLKDLESPKTTAEVIESLDDLLS
ncbi:MutS protein msh5 [Beauveria asiatica]|uniref:MutS protein msh5 n=1 Tax=Beauveria asiatica TaxID=1069075 RepID=A0AAW0RTW4_9HYPO